MSRVKSKGRRGKRTVSAKRGNPSKHARRQRSILPLIGTGRGLWGSDSTRTLRELRDEWDR